MVCITATMEQLQALERIMSRTRLMPEQLRSMAEAIQGLSADHNIKYALKGELCVGLSAFRMPASGVAGMFGVNNPLLGKVLALMRVSGLQKKDALSYLGIMQDYLDASELPAPEHLATVRAIAQAVEHGKRGGFLPRMLVPGLGRVMERESQVQAHGLAAYCALAVEQYRLTTDRLPERVSRQCGRLLPPASPGRKRPATVCSSTLQGRIASGRS